MKNKKSTLIIMLIVALFVLSGCQRNVDANGVTLAERVISLSTAWKEMMNESFFTALFVYPLSQAINLVYKFIGSSVLSVIIVTIIYNVIILPFSIKSTVSTQKMQMIQPELLKIQAKYEGRNDDQSRMAQAQEMQNVYNKYNINPLGSLITPFLQFPILIAMFYAVQRADAVCNGTFVGHPLTTTPLFAIKNIGTLWPMVVIYVLMIVAQLLSTKVPQMLADKQRKKQKGYKKYADNGPTSNTQTNVMMYSMVLLVGVLAINWPLAMSVYWLINSVVNVLKTVFIQWRYIDNE